MSPARVQSITYLPPPTSIKQNQSFLGVTNFIDRLFPFTLIWLCPSRLLQRMMPRLCGHDQCAEAFKKLKEAVSSDAVLAQPDQKAPF
jgi:hypothetical protein